MRPTYLTLPAATCDHRGPIMTINKEILKEAAEMSRDFDTKIEAMAAAEEARGDQTTADALDELAYELGETRYRWELMHGIAAVQTEDI